ncbi:MAG: hypothetical protein WDA59_00015 [Methanofastidiosum sp.]
MTLNKAHWTFPYFKQRMTKKEWKQILLNEEDTIVYKGNIVKLKVNNLGCGVVEVYKDIN